MNQLNFRKSIVGSRTFVLLISTVLLAGGLMMLWSNYMTGHFQNRAAVEELTAKAVRLAEQTVRLHEGTISGDSYNTFLRTAPDLLDAGVLLELNKDVTWGRIRQPSRQPWTQEELSSFEDLVRSYRYYIDQRENVVFTAQTDPQKGDIVFVGVPMIAEVRRSDKTEVIGGAYLFKHLNDYDTGATPLLLSFLAAMLFTLGAMAAPAIYFVNLTVRPLLQIRDVAKGISEGDFSKKASPSYKGEFKDLSLSINQMAQHLQQTIQDLETESNRLQQVFNGLNEGIIALTSQLYLTHMNPTFRLFFPQARKAKVSTPLKDLGLGDLEASFEQAMQTGNTQFLTLPLQDKTIFGQILPLTTAEGSIQGVVGLFRDITEEARLEQTRRDYVANISHELKTPLTAMRCMVEPMMDGMIQKPEMLQRYYGIIYDETLRMSRLIDDMLELSRLQTGRTPIELLPFTIDRMLTSLATKFSTVAAEKSLHFELDRPSTPLPTVYANPDRVEQIIYIFLDNAAKFTPEGGKITLRARVEEEQNRLVLCVQDTGKGISQEDQQHIFERFYKADKSRGTVGTGLGLSIAKEITEQTGQSLWVESEPGHGASFFLTLALYEEDSPALNED